MNTTRLEALSDGVIAITITIMALQLEPPEAATLNALINLAPTFVSYLLSFAFVGIFWHNHHNLLQAADEVTTQELWLNLNFLFWLSLLPFVTGWVDHHVFSSVPVALYGAILAACSTSFMLLRRVLLRTNTSMNAQDEVQERRWTFQASLSLQTLGIGIAFLSPLTAIGLYVVSLGPWVLSEIRPLSESN
ncbi:MAG: TMEM175 family protein [Pseudomonadota bacterium]